MLTKIKATYREFPREFWILVAASFIDRLGATMIFPFFALYVTQRFDVGMTEAGVLIAIFSLSGFAGSLVGGVLTDRFGRRSLIIFGLVASALSSLIMGFVNDLTVFYVVALFAGLLSDMAGPAHGAMVADLLPAEQRAEGFGLIRVAGNLAWIIGPSIGGVLAATSYLLLFVLDAVSSLTTAVIVYRFLPETKPAAVADEAGSEMASLLGTVRGYSVVLKDHIYMIYILIMTIVGLGYTQIYSTLSVYLRDEHGVTAGGFGFLLSMNAAVVVVTQFWLTRRLSGIAPLLLMTAGSLLYMVGLGMYGFVSLYALFVLAMLLITFGEMIIIPQSNSLAANFAPEAMRGRYLALFGLTWTISGALGPWGAGLIMDNGNPDWIWYLAAILSAVAAGGFVMLYLVTRKEPVINS